MERGGCKAGRATGWWVRGWAWEVGAGVLGAGALTRRARSKQASCQHPEGRCQQALKCGQPGDRPVLCNVELSAGQWSAPARPDGAAGAWALPARRGRAACGAPPQHCPVGWLTHPRGRPVARLTSRSTSSSCSSSLSGKGPASEPESLSPSLSESCIPALQHGYRCRRSPSLSAANAGAQGASSPFCRSCQCRPC